MRFSLHGVRQLVDRKATVDEPRAIFTTYARLSGIFVSGPGAQQIYRMNADGADVQRVTNGEGEASNPSWSPDGQKMAFSWTQGYSKGQWNIFVMEFGSGQYVQLTHGEGKNENPVWAPDGRHLVFTSTRSGRPQIYTMLADGTQVKLLTQQGSNRSPVWGVK